MTATVALRPVPSLGGRFRAALWAELLKGRHARAPLGIAASVGIGIPLLSATMTLAAGAGRAEVIAKLGPLGHLAGWPLLIGIATQIGAAALAIADGIALSWVVGREHADATVEGLFALPTSRATVAAAKLAAYVLWAMAAAAVLALVLVGSGLALGLGPPDAAAVTGITRLLGLALLSLVVVVPVAAVASQLRSMLAGIGATVALVVLAQVGALSSLGAWMPLAAPALWALGPTPVGWPELTLVLLVGLLGAWVTLVSWTRLQLDR